MISPEPAGDDIAVIGLACRFPGEASGPQEFWNLLCKGRCMYPSTKLYVCHEGMTNRTLLQPPTHPPQNGGTSTLSTTPNVDAWEPV